jgi:hypothetical protein
VILLRKPLLFLLVLATGASLAGGGRLSLRLLLDTAVVLAIIPVIQVVAFAAVYWTGRTRLGLAWAVDGFFSGNGPWFAAVTIVAAFGAFASPVAAAQWFSRVGTVAFLAAIVVSVRLDFAYFRDVLGRTRQRAAVDVVVQRAIAWSITVAYFIVMSTPKIASTLSDVTVNLFGARP